MSKIIYNEGRVVGYSAYEIYVQQFLSQNPDGQPATEREWLASTLALGSSILFKFPAINQSENSETYVDIPLPSNSQLCAANTVIATYFNGDAKLDDNGIFAIQVSDYGELISNTSELYPTDAPTQLDVSTNVPVKPQSEFVWSNSKIQKLHSYLQILSGIVIQPGYWTSPENSYNLVYVLNGGSLNPLTADAAASAPWSDFTPNMSQTSVLRFHVKGTISEQHRPLLLISGFSNRAVVTGETGIDSSLQELHPENGDFLGPAMFPWANKIILTVPTIALNLAILGIDEYVRKTGDIMTGSLKISSKSSYPSISQTHGSPSFRVFDQTKHDHDTIYGLDGIEHTNPDNTVTGISFVTSESFPSQTYGVIRIVSSATDAQLHTIDFPNSCRYRLRYLDDPIEDNDAVNKKWLMQWVTEHFQPKESI